MAFVYRGERRIQMSANELNEVGPGQYLSQDLIKPSKNQSKAPFNINTYRDHKLKKLDVPGPGSYEYDDKYEKFSKLISKQNEKEIIEPFYKSVENKFATKNSPFFSTDKKEPGFGSKLTRFKIIQSKNQVPGPGHYELHDNLKRKSNSPPKQTNKTTINLLGSPNRILSIPSKNNCFGYNIRETGIPFMNEDPDKNLRYKGVIQDSVGPGSYDISKVNSWFKNSIDWSRSANKILNRSLDNLNSTMINSYDMHTLENNVKDIEATNKRTVEKMKYKKGKEKIFKQIAEKRRELLNLNKSVKDSESLVDKIINKETPGPGYYFFDEENKANFRPEQFQVFGSSSPRFPLDKMGEVSNNNEVGPGYYFNDDSKFEKMKVQQIRDKMGIQMIKKKEGGQAEKSKKEKLEVEMKLGPGIYNPEVNIKKPITNVSHFGSLEKRFIHKNKEIESSPGPGSYLDQSNWIRNKQMYLKREMIRRYEKDANPLLDRQEELQIPGVGSYDPDKILSVGYKVAQKTNQYQSAIAPFSSMQRRFEEFKNDNIGPGQYYKEKKVDIGQVYPPFRVGDRKDREDIKQPVPGPSDYSKSSYFDWNKKSYNILYL
jgi:hypothetical protein